MRDTPKNSTGATANRRGFPRVAAAHLLRLSAPSGAVLTGRTMNLALGGLGVETYGAEGLGEAITGEELAVALVMHGELVEVAGVIVRCRCFADEGYALSLRLPSPTPGYRRLLAETFADAG